MRWSALFALVFGLAVASLASAQTTTDRKVVYTYWEGSIDCKNGHKYVVEYTEGAGCHQVRSVLPFLPTRYLFGAPLVWRPSIRISRSFVSFSTSYVSLRTSLPLT
jgi:hypothetical protein